MQRRIIKPEEVKSGMIIPPWYSPVKMVEVMSDKVLATHADGRASHWPREEYIVAYDTDLSDNPAIAQKPTQDRS